MKSKFALFSGSCLCLLAVQYLLQREALACVVLVEAEANPDLDQLKQFLRHHQIPMLQYREESDSKLISDLDRLGANRGLVYLFRHKIRSEVIRYFDNDIVNIHPSALPEFRGPMPLFWQLKEGAETVRLTLHKVTEELDCGAIGADLDIPVHPFDTSQCLHQKVAQMVPALLEQFVQQEAVGSLNWCEQPQGEALQKIHYARHVKIEDLIIDFQQHTSTQIVNLARAANAELGGARFKFRDGLIQLMQATRVDCDLIGVRSGTVVELERTNGLLVKTIDGAVRLDSVLTEQGIFDGYRFAILFGLEPGMEVSNL
ncbi:methionyl-tRNA formyltransferase [Pseudoalteromonas piscicida]|uniref:methionyl-tRNA formyltransferase n=1 Tax=Pseudoalteromonas piscicida TaxID=43662 RepID=UPI0030AF3CE0